MNVGHGRLQLADDGIIAGVCSGLAEFLSLDVGVLRFAFVALAVVSAGGFALLYIAAWLLLPKSSHRDRQVDVHADAPCDGKPAQERSSAVRKRKARAQIASEPPVPPPAPGMETLGAPRDTAGFAAVGIAVGVAAVVLVFCILLSVLFPVFSPFQFWPIAVVALGIVRTVIPGRMGYRMEAFCDGTLLIMLGMVFLMSTTGVLIIDEAAWIGQGWPLLVMALGCLVLWKATALDGFGVAMLVLVAAFCLAGLLFCFMPGPAYYLLSTAPPSDGFVRLGGVGR